MDDPRRLAPIWAIGTGPNVPLPPVAVYHLALVLVLELELVAFLLLLRLPPLAIILKRPWSPHCVRPATRPLRSPASTRGALRLCCVLRPFGLPRSFAPSSTKRRMIL